MVVIFVNYTPSPEAKYPVALEEAYVPTKWIAQNGKTVNVNASRLAVAGDSVGGNMAAAVALLSKERDGPPIRFQLLFYPVTDANFETSSYMKYQEGYWLSREAMKWFWDNYVSNQTNIKEPTVSPFGRLLTVLGDCHQLLSSTENLMWSAMKERHMLTN